MSVKNNTGCGIDELKASFEHYKEQGGSQLYAACFGKTFIDSESTAYREATAIGKLAIEKGFGVLHGGYSGLMDAVSTGASEAIAGRGLSPNWNIGVPMYTFDADTKIKRTESVHLPAARDIYARKEALVTFNDVCIVLPVGGFGTLLETIDIFHANQLAEKFGGKIRPIIFMGEHWKKLFTEELPKYLDMHLQKDGDNFCYFVTTTEEVGQLLETIKHTTK